MRVAPLVGGGNRSGNGSGRSGGSGAGGGRGVAGERERVVDVQRARLLGAMAAVAGERGSGNVTVAHVVERAGVSRRTFYELFSDVEDCLLAALDEALHRAGARVVDAYDPSAPWRARLRAGLTALLCLFDEEPALARLLVVESLAAGPAALVRRNSVLVPVIAAVEQGRTESKRAEGAPRLAAETVVGGVLALLYARIAEAGGQRPQRPLSGLANELMSMIVLPYLGHAGARRELNAPLQSVAVPVREGRQSGPDPFKAAGMRLTYRTMRVLSAVAACPQASNRQIARAAGVDDQGQISKLLARLLRLGLVVNESDESAKAANAWTLTRTGQRVVDRIGIETQPE